VPESPSPPDFADVVDGAPAPLGDAALAALVRSDAVRCGELYELVPTIARYVGLVDPATDPDAAREVAHQVVHAARTDRDHVLQRLSSIHPAWARLLREAALALDLLGSDDDAGPLPAAVGEPMPDGAPRFIVGDVIARGAFGVIAEGLDRMMADHSGGRSDVVVKFVRGGAGEEPWAEESRRASAITHPCGIEVRAHGSVGGGMGYVVFERIRGRSLVAMAAAEERMALPRAIAAMGELCDAIAELHRAGLAHGDLSPANVILDSLGRLRLVDYGLAQPIRPERAAVDVARAGALLQWLMLGHVPRGPGPGADHAPGWRGRMVQVGWECRERPGTALGLADRLLRAEWSRERVVSWAVGAGVGVLFLAFGAISRLLF
jgi:hypothetical protein